MLQSVKVSLVDLIEANFHHDLHLENMTSPLRKVQSVRALMVRCSLVGAGCYIRPDIIYKRPDDDESSDISLLSEGSSLDSYK